MSNSVLHFKTAGDQILKDFTPLFLKEKNNHEALLMKGLEFAALLTTEKTNSLNMFASKASESAEIDNYLKKLIDDLWLLVR